MQEFMRALRIIIPIIVHTQIIMRNAGNMVGTAVTGDQSICPANLAAASLARFGGIPVDYGQLEKEVHSLVASQQLEDAEKMILRERSQFLGRSLGRVHRLHAAVARRLRPNDRDGFFTLCADASRLLQGDYPGLCSLYLAQSAAAISWGEWQTARTTIRRMRALLRRHPDLYELQQKQGEVLGNEGLVESIHGNHSRAIELLTQSIAMMDRYLYPPHEASRRTATAVKLVDIANSHLALGDRSAALEALSHLDSRHLRSEDLPRYNLAQCRYWLTLGNTGRARTWFVEIYTQKCWRPDWPVLVLELEADLLVAEGRAADAVVLFEQAIEHPFSRSNAQIRTRLQPKLDSAERVLSR